jgi:hypothetical protein
MVSLRAGIHPFGCALSAVLQPSESSTWCSCRQLRSCPLPRDVLAQNFCASAEQAPRSAPLPVPGCVVCATAVCANMTVARQMMRRSILMRPSMVSLFRQLTGRWDSIRRLAIRQAGQLLLRPNNSEAPSLNLGGGGLCGGSCDDRQSRGPSRLTQLPTRPRRAIQRAPQT